MHRNTVAVLERIVQHRQIGIEPAVEPVLDRAQLLELSALAARIYLPDVVVNYVARLVDATHAGQSKTAGGIKFGASPRAALGLAAAARARALLEGRLNASFEDVRAVAVPVLQHRLVLDYHARIDGLTAPEVVRNLLEEVPVQAQALPAVLRATKP